MTHVASEVTGANHSGVITAPSFGSGNEHATPQADQAGPTCSPIMEGPLSPS